MAEQKTSLIERIPPHNLEAEQAVLGSLLIDKDAIVRIADVITPEDFYKEAHRIIYDTMLELYSKREPTDLLTLSNILEEKKKLEEIGGRSYLMNLANIVPTSSNVVYYANIVQKKATLRRLIESASRIMSLGFREDEDTDIVLDEAEKSLFSVSQKYLKQNFIPIKTALTDAFDRIDELHKSSGKLRGLRTGFHELDNILAGLQKADLIILAARPSVGKTTLALDIARHVAVKEKVPVGIFSFEMSKETLVDRLLCAEANVSLFKMRTGRLSGAEEEDDFPRIGNAMGILSESPIFIDDSPLSNVMEIRSKTRRLQSEHGLGLLVVDYLQLMEGRSNLDNRVLEIAEITRGLKGVARELNIPVIALSQLNRAVESRSPAIPKLADLRDSGSIEQDADVVMFIYRPTMDKSVREVEEGKRHLAEIHISKHRNGPTGIIELRFDEDKVSFKNLERQRTEEAIPEPSEAMAV